MTMMSPATASRIATRWVPVRRVLAVTLITAGALAACGADGDDGPELSAAAAAGRSLYRTSGCSACHGTDGEGGGLGPALQGLYGAETSVILDGQDTPTTVTADEEYLHQSIREPDAAKTEGYADKVMPVNPALSDADVASLIAYIEAIGPDAAGESDG